MDKINKLYVYEDASIGYHCMFDCDIPGLMYSVTAAELRALKRYAKVREREQELFERIRSRGVIDEDG